MDFRRRRTDLEAGALKSNQPELADLVFRSLDLKGQLPLELEREYGLQLAVEDFTRPEFYRARRRAWWAASDALAAGGAGTYATLQLLAPSGNMLTVVERVIIAPSATDYFRIAISTPAAGLLPVVVRSLDSRNGVGGLSGASTLQSGNPAVLPLGSGSLLVRGISSTTLVVEGPWILGPDSGSALIVANGTANVASTLGMVWSERHATDAELR